MAKRRFGRVPVPRAVEHSLDSVLDKALSIQRPMVLSYLDKVQRSEPDLTPTLLVARLEKRYVATAVAVGGASGAAAAVPGVGTAASVASGIAEVGAFVSATAMFVLALAELHGISVSDPEVRRALVLAVLVGDSGVAALQATGRADAHWAQVFARRAARDGVSGAEKLGGLNGHLAKLALRRFGARQGALLFGRALPLGIGAAIGAGGNAALARGAIATARKAFGPPPKTFPPRVVDAVEHR